MLAIKGEIRVFTKVVDTAKGTRVIFNACVGATKQEDDSYINYYMPVNFSNALRKDVAKVYTKDSFDVVIKSAWIKAYKDKEDNTRPILFINEATIVSEDKPKAKKKTSSKAKKEELEPVDDDSLPF